MRTEEKSQVKNSVGRMAFVVLAVLIQFIWITVMVLKLQKYSVYLSILLSVLAFLVVLHIYGKQSNAAFKMPWIMLILVFPLTGLTLYVLMGNSGVTHSKRKYFEMIDSELFPKLKQDAKVLERLEAKDLAVANESRYIWKFGKFPVYQNTDVEFYSDASDGLEAQLKELKKAEKFIFMEYHAIEDTRSFHRILDVLKEKVKEGVDVRLLYDDIGSIGFINNDFIKRMQKDGIACRVFNPIVPILSVFMNHRDHRKITVIDGKVGFTGGYNLADEYFNLTHPYGHWKDTGLRLEGDAIRSLTLMFLEMWNAIRKTDADYDMFLTEYEYHAKETGFIQPYADSPLDDEPVGENVYLNIIKQAKRYVYFTTPYLIISDEMKRELTLAAKRGVDVRIITPGIPDKKMVFQVTRSHYANLVAQGVKIYEYTPGFIHAKQCVADDETAVCGTINMDWRSLYLHFENAVWLHACSCIKEIKKDFDECFTICENVTEKYRGRRSAPLRLGQCLLRLISPLL